ncbi:MAG: enolase C-terminal domain-like protein [Sphingobium sp.]|uniref:mandelate racemase/muconate lactonizing enzyme family protein n=1 Tax=Sphingobium sp. TaxID=1912891 RepID=UPI0029AB725C|nr:enolase C-terminal domain-like protein [Sphingobium sp.]MDX3911763.1 enolase C-terminal domain-like protein [Sphingobium sp.]
MKIRSIEAIPFRLPLKHVVKFAAGSLSHLEHVLVRILSDEGAEGWAEAPARQMIYGETSKSIVAAIDDYFSPALAGLDPFNIEEAWRRMAVLPWNHCAKAGIDVALHDLCAKLLNIPLYKLIGGFGGPIAVCHILGTSAPQAVAEEAIELHERLGISWFKLKAGLDPAGDTTMIGAVRDALPDAQLTADCNQGYSAEIAERTLPTWDQFQLAWIEEPCPGTDPVGRSRVAAVCRTPFMLDESAFLPHEIVREAELGNCRIVSIKTARTGVTKSKEVMHVAEAHGMKVVVGSQAESELGTLAGAHLATAHHSTSMSSSELSFFLDVDDRITRDTLTITGGKLKLPPGPGTGLDIDEQRLNRLRVDR